MSHSQRKYLQSRLKVTGPMKDVLISLSFFPGEKTYN